MNPLPVDPSVPECLACGACCFGLLVRIDPDDEERFTAAELEKMSLVDSSGIRHMRQVAEKKCIFLEVSSGRFFCQIYERRPGVCVKFDRGSKYCGEARTNPRPT